VAVSVDVALRESAAVLVSCVMSRDMWALCARGDWGHRRVKLPLLRVWLPVTAALVLGEGARRALTGCPRWAVPGMHGTMKVIS
jgi:hypothetical protein